MELWKNPSEIDAALHLPSKNEFIPIDFSIRAGDQCNDGLVDSTYPRCIVDEPLMKFWYKLDSTFKVPRANTYFRINLKGGYDNAKSCVLSELFIHLLKDELNEIIYQVNHLSSTALKLLVCLLLYALHERTAKLSITFLAVRFVVTSVAIRPYTQIFKALVASYLSCTQLILFINGIYRLLSTIGSSFKSFLHHPTIYYCCFNSSQSTD